MTCLCICVHKTSASSYFFILCFILPPPLQLSLLHLAPCIPACLPAWLPPSSRLSEGETAASEQLWHARLVKLPLYSPCIFAASLCGCKITSSIMERASPCCCLTGHWATRCLRGPGSAGRNAAALCQGFAPLTRSLPNLMTC